MLDRLNTGERLMGAGAIGLVISLWLPWFGTKEEENPFIPPARQVTINAWESFSLSDIAILLVALGTLAALVNTLRGLDLGRDRRALLGILAASSVVFGIAYARIEEPLKSTSTRYGIWVGLLAALAIAVGAYLTLERLARR